MKKKESFIDYLLEIPNYMTFFVTPIYLFTVGPMLIEMSKNLGISIGNLNLIFTFFTVGSVIGQLTSVLYNKKIRSVLIVIFFYLFIIAALLPLLFNTNLYVFYFLYFIIGYSSGVIFVQAAKSVLESNIANKERLTTVLMFFYPLGNITAPFIASALINNNYSWRFSYYIMIFITVINVILYFTLKLRYKGGTKVETEQVLAFKKIFYDKRINVIFLTGCILGMLYCVSETVMTAWLPTYLRTGRSMDIFYAGFSVSLFWFGILAGRIVVSIIAGKFKSSYIILILSIFAFASLIIFILVKSSYLLLIFAAVSGLFFSGIPTLQTAITGTVYEKGRGVLISIIFATQYLGTSMAPILTKSIASKSMIMSVGIAPVFILLVIITIVVKIILDNRYEREILKLSPHQAL